MTTRQNPEHHKVSWPRAFEGILEFERRAISSLFVSPGAVAEENAVPRLRLRVKRGSEYLTSFQVSTRIAAGVLLACSANRHGK